jgi:hypothetical protein
LLSLKTPETAKSVNGIFTVDPPDAQRLIFGYYDFGKFDKAIVTHRFLSCPDNAVGADVGRQLIRPASPPVPIIALGIYQRIEIPPIPRKSVK